MLTLLLLTTLPVADETANWAPPPTAAETAIADSLRNADTPDAVRTVAQRAMQSLGPDNASVSVLQDAIESGTNEDAQRAAESLTYRPLAEAPLAKDYPSPTRLHAIEIKQLPAYRQAVVTMTKPDEQPKTESAATLQRKGQSTGAFWSLFQHIQQNDIAMTAPVRTQYEEPTADAEPASMAFLYRQPTMGQVADGDTVDVIDVPARTVISTGIKSDDRKAVADAERRLRQYLDTHPGYVIDGPLEVLGYNAPMTPANKRIVEVQFPVKQQ